MLLEIWSGAPGNLERCSWMLGAVLLDVGSGAPGMVEQCSWMLGVRNLGNNATLLWLSCDGCLRCPALANVIDLLDVSMELHVVKLNCP